MVRHLVKGTRYEPRCSGRFVRRGRIHALVVAGALLACACVEQEQLPLDAALRYVYEHPEYVIADPDSDVMVGVRPDPEQAELDRHLAGDWVARQLVSYSAADEADKISWARRSVEIVREVMLSQREPGLFLDSDDCLCDEGFSDGAFARLVRGFSNCDGVNGVLAMLLLVRMPQVELRHLDGVDNGHSLVALPRARGLVFIDAWADFGLMALAEAPVGVLDYAELAPLSVDDAGFYEREDYEQSQPDPDVDLFFGGHDPKPDLRVLDTLPPIRDARDAYLRARVLDLYGLELVARPWYEQAIEMSCEDPNASICQLARASLPLDGQAISEERI